MSIAILTIAGAMFGIPLVIMLFIALIGLEIPSSVLSVGGWSMALALILGGIGAVMNWVGQ